MKNIAIGVIGARSLLAGNSRGGQRRAARRFCESVTQHFHLRSNRQDRPPPDLTDHPFRAFQAEVHFCHAEIVWVGSAMVLDLKSM